MLKATTKHKVDDGPTATPGREAIFFTSRPIMVDMVDS
jgi:hypothetical protein